MARDLELEKAVFALGTGADVMNHLVWRAFCGCIAYPVSRGVYGCFSFAGSKLNVRPILTI